MCFSQFLQSFLPALVHFVDATLASLVFFAYLCSDLWGREGPFCHITAALGRRVKG